MTLNRWQDTVVNLFAEIAILEMLVKTRIGDRRPAGLNENHFAMLNHLVRANGQGNSRTAFAWSFGGMCDSTMVILREIRRPLDNLPNE
jgi:hypothetical protein